MESFSEFIVKHENDDTARLLLSGKFPDNIDPALAASTIEVRRKLKKKVPSWHARPELVYPLKLSGEQCSSEAAAMYKASLAESVFSRFCTSCGKSDDKNRKPNIADITGGLGVDAWAFSGIAGMVLYNEMNPVLANAAAANFQTLGRDNISVKSFMITARHGRGGDGKPQEGPGGLSGTDAKTPSELLDGFKPDIIFLDPARRSSDGAKVFLLEHCSPDVLELKEELLSICRFILLKLSPMADIEMLLDRLGDNVCEIHILAADGECKEILLLMDREFHGECRLAAANFTSAGWARMEFGRNDLKKQDGCASLAESVSPGDILFEPGKALMKAGVFQALCGMFPLKKLGKFTHYYILDTSAPSAGDAAEKLADFGKFFTVTEALPMNKRTIKETGEKYPQAEVTARNIKMDTDTLRKKLGVSSGGNVHIFGLSCDFPCGQENLLIVCTR